MADTARVKCWRRRAGPALASLAVAVAVPRGDRATTGGRVGAALSIDPCP